MRARAKLISRTAVVIGLAVLAAAGIALRGEAVAQWHLWRFGSGDPEIRREAAARLGELRCRRAIPHLVERMWRDRNDPAMVAAALGALKKIGPEAEMAIRRKLFNSDGLPREVREMLFYAEIQGRLRRE
jgi:hypothetical protein